MYTAIFKHDGYIDIKYEDDKYTIYHKGGDKIYLEDEMSYPLQVVDIVYLPKTNTIIYTLE